MAKMNARASAILVLFMVSILLISCAENTRLREFAQVTNIDPQSLNTKIKLSGSDVYNAYKNGDLISVVITNVSEKSVFFSDDFGIKMYTMEGEDWVEVQNSYFYRNHPGTLPPNKEVPISFVAAMLPVLPDLLDSQEIRVVVTGYLDENRSEPTSAFIDITVHP